MRIKIVFGFLAMALLATAGFGQTATASSDPHLAKAVELRAQAQSAYDSGDYDGASALARQASAELAQVPGAPPVKAASAESPSLPASYTVRLIPNDRDSLSKIAGYPFIYGNRAQWPLIYRANKATLKHPENADIILPGEILVIPSIAGEMREGVWVEGKDYPSLALGK